MASAPADWEYRHLQENLYPVRPRSSKSWQEFQNIEPLATILAQQAKWSAHPTLVFSTPEGKPWDPDGITARWSKMLAEAGNEKHDGPLKGQTPVEDRVTLHGARHTVVDLLYLLEVPEALITEIVGRSSRQVTRGYKSKNSTAVKKAVTKIVNLLQRGPAEDDTASDVHAGERHLELVGSPSSDTAERPSASCWRPLCCALRLA
ncbi:hypothetical protein [Nesterenkonia populi]